MNRIIPQLEKNFLLLCMLCKSLLLFKSNILLRIDHNALRCLWESKDVFGQCARWLELMAKFDFKFVYHSGSVPGNANALSRCPSREENFFDDCPFCYENDLVNEVEHFEGSTTVDMFAIDFRECRMIPTKRQIFVCCT